MRICEIAGDESKSLLVGDVALDAFDPVTTRQLVRVGLMVDFFILRVVPVITTMTVTTEKERDALARVAIRHHRVNSRGMAPLFGPIPGYALIEPSKTGHLMAPYDVEGKRSGRLRDVTWLGDVTLMESSPSNNLNPIIS